MNKKQYTELCKICDHVLLSGITSKARISIPWLHVLRQHPYLLKQYESLFSKKFLTRNFFSEIYFFFRSSLIFFRLVLLASLRYRKSWFGSCEQIDEVNFLFVSHLINTSHAGNLDDFYFGDLPRKLSKQGYKVAIVLLNHTKENPEKIIARWADEDTPRIILSDILSFSQELEMRSQLAIEAKTLSKLSLLDKRTLTSKIFKRASQEAYSNGAYRCLRIYKQIQDLAVKLKPSVLVTTFEGHSWERIAFAAAHEAIPEITCLGYQNSAIFEGQHSIVRCLGKPYDPDGILSSGSVTLEQLKTVFNPKKIPVTFVGSCRISNTNALQNQRQGQTCLVLPEGILSECNELFTFSMRCAELLPWINFIWRLHPLIGVNQVEKYNTILKKIPSNIKFSNRQLENDISECTWALYRGSAAIIQVAINGVQPIYLKLKNEDFGIDPLWTFQNQWKRSIKNYEEFINLVGGEEKNSVEKDKFKTEIVNYCHNYNLPFNYGELPRILKNK